MAGGRFLERELQMTRVRDTQRGKLYRAEQAFWHGAYGGDCAGGAVRLETMAEVEAFAESVLAKRSVQRRFGWQRPLEEYRDGRGRRSAYAEGGYAIGVPRSLRSRWVVLHELSHVIVQRTFHPEPAWHGWEFADVYLQLVWCVLGKEAHNGLRDAFRANGVRYKAPRARRQLTEEQREALRLRMAGMRELQAARVAK